SLYLGSATVALSVYGALAGPRRWAWFWTAVIIVGAVLSFGDYSPVYPAMQRVLPLVRTFRYPAKFFVFVVLGLVVLLVAAVEAFERPSVAGEDKELVAWRSPARAALLTAAIGLFLFLVLFALVRLTPFVGARIFYQLASRAHLVDPVGGVQFL